MKRVFLHIDQLRVRGYGNHDASLLGESLRTEFAAQFATGVGPGQLRGRDELSVRTQIAPMTRSAGPVQVGVQAAQSVARGLKS